MGFNVEFRKEDCNIILDAVVTFLKYKKITIDHAIYTKMFYDDNVYYILVSIYDVLNYNNNETDSLN